MIGVLINIDEFKLNDYAINKPTKNGTYYSVN